MATSLASSSPFADGGVAADAAVAAPLKPAAPTRLVFAFAFLLGFGLLLTYNFLLNLIPFFVEVWAWPEAAFFVALCLSYPSLLVQVVMLTVGGRVSAALRIRGSLALNALTLVLLVAAAPASRSLGLALLALSGLATSVLEASLFGSFAELGGNGTFSQTGMAGAGAAGVVACVLQIAITAAMPGQQSAAAALYAALGCAVLLACIVAHVQLQQLPYVRACAAETALAGAAAARAGAMAGANAGASDGGERAGTPKGDKSEAPVVMLLSPMSGELAAVDPLAEIASFGGGGGGDKSGGSATARWFIAFKRAGRGVAGPAAAVFVQFVATFLAFPGLTSTVPFKGSATGGESSVDWFSFLLLNFGVFDVVGRALATRHSAPSDPLLLCYAFARFAWTPLIAACARSWGPGFGDAAILAIMAGFGFTNGHCAALCVGAAARVKPRDRELAGFILVAALHCGIAVGSNVALGVFDPAGS